MSDFRSEAIAALEELLTGSHEGFKLEAARELLKYDIAERDRL